MKFTTLDRRISSLEDDSEGSCPHCQAIAAMTEEDIDSRLAAVKAGQYCEELPEPSPSCEACHKYDCMTEAELDAELTRLMAILEQADAYGS